MVELEFGIVVFTPSNARIFVLARSRGPSSPLIIRVGGPPAVTPNILDHSFIQILLSTL